MTLNTTGFFLENTRVSTGNSVYTFPPTVGVTDSTSFNSSTGRVEYLVTSDSLSSSTYGLEIADPDLRFLWTKNETPNNIAINRFDYDNFGRRWSPLPGSSPTNLGPIANGLIVQVPDLISTDSPFDIYIGSPIRVVTFIPQIVDSFGSPPIGTVEIKSNTGELNFNSIDIGQYSGQSILYTRQSFFDRQKNKGIIGSFPSSAFLTFSLFLNPRPGSGQIPKIRIGYQSYLNGVQVPSKTSFTSQLSGNFQWALDTGELNFSLTDITNNLSEVIYYDGVYISSFQLLRTLAGTISGSTSSFPSSTFNTSNFVSLVDPVKYVLVAEKTNKPRIYFSIIIVKTTVGLSPPPSGSVYIDSITGSVYFNSTDISTYDGYSISYINTIALVERGVSVQFFRSGANSTKTAQVSDFQIRYEIPDPPATQGQLIQNGILQTPFVMLPTIPIVNSNLKYEVVAGSGTFTGILKDGKDPTKLGIGYFLDLDNKQLNFTQRKNIVFTLPKSTSMVKIPDSSVISAGLSIEKNDVPITPGVDFSFNQVSGILEFTQPIGINDPNNINNIVGSVTLSNIYIASQDTFSGSNVGKFLLIENGPNVGIYTITSFDSPTTIRVSPDFISSGATIASVVQSEETIADRFFINFLPPFKKFKLERAENSTSSFVTLENTEYSVQPDAGIVSILTPALPGNVYRINYIHLAPDSQGLSTVPTDIIEIGSSKIRLEKATTTVGSRTIAFNPDNRPIDTTRPIVAYIDGVTQEENAFVFTPPNRIDLIVPITSNTEIVKVDYYVNECLGGETSFNTLYTPIDIDKPTFVSNSNTTTFNGNQTNYFSPGSPIRIISTSEIVLVQSSSYDSVNDVTNVVLEKPLSSNFFGEGILLSESVTQSYRIIETSIVSAVAFNTNFISINEDKSAVYQNGTIITLDDDPYLVVSSSYDSNINRTKVNFGSSAIRNYILPVVTRTVRPVFLPSSKFNTLNFADVTSFPFTLIKMGQTRKILIRDVDYSVSEGGNITLTTKIIYGDSLHALYVARVDQPAGTKFKINYAHQIAPNESNGISGQKLYANYDLYAPDAFFYRIETFQTFLPEVQEDIKRGTQSAGVSGPNTSDSTSLQNKDQGSPSPGYDETHLFNLDVVIIRLLQYYNDLVNQYEDILSNLDGRVVGGRYGRFRFDGIVNNPPRNDFSDITNDIDDKVILYYKITINDSFTFVKTPVYGFMYNPNSISRIYPTKRIVTAALNAVAPVTPIGEAFGSLDITNITSASTFTSSKARSTIKAINVVSTFAIPAGQIIQIEKNGDPDNLVPAFVVGQQINAYDQNGNILTNPSNPLLISAITGIGPFNLVVDKPIFVQNGSVLADTSDAAILSNHFYTPGRDIGVDNNNGQIINITIQLPPPFDNSQVPIVGNELIDTTIVFQNIDTAPNRVPALDGSELGDDKRVSEPIMKRTSESDDATYFGLLRQESFAISNIKIGTLQPDLTTVFTNIFLPVGATFLFTEGPNAGLTRIVISVTGLSFVLNSSLVTPDLNPRSFAYSISNFGYENIYQILSEEVGVIRDNNASLNIVGPPPIVPTIGSVASEIKSIQSIIGNYGSIVASGTGTAAPGTFTDIGQNFGLLIGNSIALLYIDSGPNEGLYSVASATGSVIIIDTSNPFVDFPSSGSTPYSLILTWSFLIPDQYGVVSEFYRKTLQFLNDTLIWSANVAVLNAPNRLSQISNRLNDINNFIQSIGSVLGDSGTLYETRYLWILQRTDKKIGTLIRKSQAEKLRIEKILNLIASQKMLLITQNLSA